jgi:hypothetical protein
MILATINKSKQLLQLSMIGRVQLEEMAPARQEVETLLAELSPGFRLLTDLGRLDSISVDCAPKIGEVMELCDQKGVSLVVRVIPEGSKDIGLNILSLFHYAHRPRTVTCETMQQAAEALSL